MIVNQFRVWAQTAAPSSRADGASALARAYLFSDLDAAQKAETVLALTELLDDPSPLVRRAIAEALASAVEAPHHIILALADDQASIASIVLARSPVLTDAELIDCTATSDSLAQAAIAERPDLPLPVAAAIAEVGAPAALVALARNASIRLPDVSIRRMVERGSDNADLREALLQRKDLPTFVKIDLVAATAQALSTFVSERNWMSDERLARISREARDKAAIVIAEANEVGPVELVAHLRRAGQLTVGFMLRSILSGRSDVVRAAFADLAGVSLSRVDALVDHCDSAGFAALYRKASLPAELLPAFRIALRATREVDWASTHGHALSRPLVERVLTACQAINRGDLDKLVVLLRRFEAEAARDEARAAPVQAAKQAPLALKPSGPTAPLVLRDLDADDEPLEAIQPRVRPFEPPAPPIPIERSLVTVDLDALEAELMLEAELLAA